MNNRQYGLGALPPQAMEWMRGRTVEEIEYIIDAARDSKVTPEKYAKIVDANMIPLESTWTMLAKLFCLR